MSQTMKHRSIDRLKARFVAKGYAQTHGIDYDERYSPVFKLTSLHILLAIAAALDLEIHVMDVITAFLNEGIDKEVYVKLPEGFNNNEDLEDLVCMLF